MDNLGETWRNDGMAPLNTQIFVVAYTVALVVGLIALMTATPATAQWAAWMQGIGSVGALVGMVYVQRDTMLESRRRDIANEARLDRAQLDLFVISLSNLGGILRGCEETSRQQIWTIPQANRRGGELNALLADMQKIELHRFEEGRALELIFKARSLAFRTRALVESIALALPKQGARTAFDSQRSDHEEIWKAALDLLPETPAIAEQGLTP